MLPLSFLLLPSAPKVKEDTGTAEHGSDRPLQMSPAALQCLICVAGISCCAAMAAAGTHRCACHGYGIQRRQRREYVTSNHVGMRRCQPIGIGWILTVSAV